MKFGESQVRYCLHWQALKRSDVPGHTSAPQGHYNAGVKRPEANILTKIVATIGPACSAVDTLVRLIEEGVRVARLNFSHGGFEQFEASLRAVRQASAKADIPVGVLGDLCGPKLRIGTMCQDGVLLHSGDRVAFGRERIEGYRDVKSQMVVLSTNYPAMVDEVSPGERVLINDGMIRMLVTDVSGSGDEAKLICSVTRGGLLTSNKGVNLPDTRLSAPSLTDYDRQCVQWAVANDLDFLALSFVRSADDVRQLHRLLTDLGKARQGNRIPVVAKIETPQATQDIEAIAEVADGVMVARGDLGVELDVAEVPVVQKRIIEAAHDYGKPVIVATQMLQSMIEEASPTRAEVSDVANAIIDGTDALMLSGETAVGKYPVQAVHVMNHTAAITEAYAMTRRDGGVGKPPVKLVESRYRTAGLAHGVSVVVNDLRCKYVVLWSELGGGARYLSQNRLPVPIIAVSSNEAALRRMGMLFGVTSVWMPRPRGTEAFAHEVDDLLSRDGWTEPGDPIVIVSGEPLGTPGVTNNLLIHYVGDVCRLTWHAKPE